MTITYSGQTAAIDDEIGSLWESCYVASEARIRLGSIQADSTSDTAAVLSIVAPEQDLNPYECVRSSRLLAFWDSREEDIYSFDDGEPV